ncbi:MAG: UDP-2,3-diacylglucosamine diphosphatase LpxI [Hyphomicrobiales bacterium]
MASNPKEKPIGVFAGGGGIVGELINALESKAQPFAVAAIEGESDDGLKADIISHFKWGQIGKIATYFREQGCEKLVLIGRINKRPDFLNIVADPSTLKRIPKIVAAMTGGDDSLLQKGIKIIEEEGFTVIGAQEVAPELLLEKGFFGSKKSFAHFEEDAVTGKAVLRDLGKHDIGQALVIHNGRVLAVEGAEGTDNMLRRVKMLREEKRITNKGATGVLIKAAKPNQDYRVDLPTIGPQTIRLASDAGLAGIICEAGKVLVASRSETYTIAKKHKIFLSGEGGFSNE